MNQEGDLPEEMEPLLQREKYTSPRLKRLLGIRKGLEHVGLLHDKVADAVSPDPPKGPAVSVTYPPLTVTVPRLEPRLAGLLDLHFALLDTDYRLIHSGSMLGLLSQAERRAFLQDCLAFHRTELEALLLPEQAGKDASHALSQLRSTVRYLPFSLQEKETVLAKLVHMQKSLHEAEGTLEKWAAGVQEVSSSETQPTRFLLLEKWMTLVRVFLYLRSWEDRSPPVFLLDDPSLEGHRPSPLLSSQETLIRMAERISTVWRRLALLLEREIAILHLNRLETLEGLLARTQFDYADALVREQERILEDLQKVPEDVGDEEPVDQEVVGKEVVKEEVETDQEKE
jgi:hypothetical protein